MLGLFDGAPALSADDAARLRRIEHKLDLLLRHLGVPCAPGDGELPAESRALADRGEKVAAIAAYRTATGAGLADAKRAVEGYMGRRGSAATRM